MTTTASDRTEPVEVGRFEALQEPVFRRLLVGGAFTFLAMQMSVIARGWIAFDLTGSNAALGGVLIGFGLSSMFAIPFGGVLADRFPKRRVLRIAGTVQAATSLALGVSVATDTIAYWMLVVASIIQGAVISLLGPARLAFIAESVARDRMTNAILLSQSSLQLTRVIGPATAGVLIGVSFVGVGGVYFLAGAIAAGGVLTPIGLPDGRPKVAPTRSPGADLVDGLRYVRSNKRLSHLLLLSFGVVLVGFPHVAFLPVVAEDIFDAGASGYGLLITASAVGAVAASLTLTGVDRRRLPRIQALAAVGFGVTLALFGLAPAFWVALVVIVLIGATSAAFQALNNSLVLGIAPVEYHGRVQSLLMLGFSGFGFAALPLGIVADAVGLRPTLTAMGLVVMAIAFTSMLINHRRQARELPL